jgi:hypothetical protein
MEIRLSIKDKYFDAFMSIISKLNYVKIHEIIDKKNIETKADGWKRVAENEEMLGLANEVEIEELVTGAQEPLTTYKRTIRPSADEIEQLIILKALHDAKAIESGKLETRDLDEFLRELETEEQL